MKPKNEILKILESGSIKIGDLILQLGYSIQSTGLDIMTKVTNGLKPLNGSFEGSKHQTSLGKLVASKKVDYIRNSNMDNWYKIPSHEWPAEIKIRKVSLKEMTISVLAELSETIKNKIDLPDIETIENDDCWVEIHPFVISLVANGWELADGDPICNWCFNPFNEKYPFNVNPKTIANDIKIKVKSGIIKC